MKFLSGSTALPRLPFQGFSWYLSSSLPPQSLSHPAAHVPILDLLDLTLASRAQDLQSLYSVSIFPGRLGCSCPAQPARLLARIHTAEGVADPVLPGAPPRLV